MSPFGSMLGLVIRPADQWASEGGVYHAARERAGRSRQHEGIDLLTFIDQPILAPATVRFPRVADPYPPEKDDILLGVYLETLDQIGIKFLYCRPNVKALGSIVPKGGIVGWAQSLQHLYPGSRDHIHAEIWLAGMRADPTPYFMDTGAPLLPSAARVIA